MSGNIRFSKLDEHNSLTLWYLRTWSWARDNLGLNYNWSGVGGDWWRHEPRDVLANWIYCILAKTWDKPKNVQFAVRKLEHTPPAHASTNERSSDPIYITKKQYAEIRKRISVTVAPAESSGTNRRRRVVIVIITPASNSIKLLWQNGGRTGRTDAITNGSKSFVAYKLHTVEIM